ncbi:plexin domain-containing protein 2 [Euwallacea fornicatus]|uniref:plexin domain-containing protein 2 n=1 Tax=Euwallacea fornicatus TaxID=995702 RepID=UPI00338E028D
MARGRYSVCGTLCSCLCIFLFIGICHAVASNLKDQCYYETDVELNHRLEHATHIELFEDENGHTRHKRDVEATKITRAASPEKVLPLAVPAGDLNDSKVTANKSVLMQLHNLGVNGTGQRLKIMARIGTELPDLNHSLVNTPKQATMEKENDLKLTPTKLTPEDVAVGDEINKKDLKNNNITDVIRDTHVFYNSSMYTDALLGRQFWVDIDAEKEGKIHVLLSNSHRRASTVKLSFAFPFYGRYITNITVATGGFIYMGNYVHSWLAATQYIAPLMANFDTSTSNSSFVKYVDSGKAFTVSWENVILQDKPGFEFSFQTTLHSNGDIVFVYKNVPLPIDSINELHHPVKVGLSDAYILDRTVFYVRRKTIFEYHRVSFMKDQIRNWTTIYLKALPTCLDLYNCSACLDNRINLNCTWCPSLHQCSTGQDRNRQYWLDNGCEKENITLEYSCMLYDDPKIPYHTNDSIGYEVESAKLNDVYIGKIGLQRQMDLGSSGYVAILFLVAMIIGFAVWTAYAYRNPQTTSGQILIRYRPSQWRWRRGEARYTAATIHM